MIRRSKGPNGVLIAESVSISGWSAEFVNVLGFVTAFYLHGTMSISGISSILVQSTTVFTIVKYLGAAYLFWVGVNALISAWRGIEATAETKPAARKRTLAITYFEGFLIDALNPKVSMFILSHFLSSLHWETLPLLHRLLYSLYIP